MIPTDFLSLLVWLAGPGLAVITSFVLDRLESFEALSPNGKLLVAVSIAGACGVLAVFLQQTIGTNSELVQLLDPYVKVLIPLASIIAQQLAHGAKLRA